MSDAEVIERVITLARFSKASKLAAVLRADGCKAADVEAVIGDDVFWYAAAWKARTRMPSDASRALCVELMREAESK